MKKRSFILFAAFAMVLAGCNNGGGRSGLENFPTSGDSVLDGALIDANIPEESETIIQLAKKPETIFEDNSFEQENIISNNYLNYGLLVYRNYEGYIGFYSLLKGDYILNRQFVPEWFTYNVVGNSQVGFFLTIRNNDTYTLYDGFGNLLYTGTDNHQGVSTTVSGKVTYATVILLNSTLYFKYGENGKATSISSIPTDPVTPVTPSTDVYDGPEYGELFDDAWIDLEGYGLPGYSLAGDGNGNYTTYKDEKALASFYVDPSVSTPLGVVGNNFVYQTKLVLPEDDTNYDYFSYDNKTKYSLETTFINLQTGEKENKKYAAVMSNLYPLKDKEGEVKYFVLVYQRINESGVLAEYNTKVIDRQFNVHDDVSGMAPQAFKKLSSDRYYNLITKILYDADLKPITYLGSMNPIFVPSLQLFRGTLNGKYGFVDINGKVATEFKYSQLFIDDFAGSNIIAFKDGKYYRLNPKTNTATELGANVSKVGENLFSINKDDSIAYISSDKTLFETYNKFNHSVISRNYLNGNKVYFINGRSSYQDTSIYYSAIKYDNFSPVAIDDEVKGDEQTTTIYSGMSYDKAQKLSVGKNSVHILSTTYVSFTPDRDGYYSFYIQQSNDIGFNSFRQGETQATSLSVTYYTSTVYKNATYNKYTALLTNNTKYVLSFSYYGSKQLTDLYLEMENGSNINYPYYISLATTKTNKIALSEFESATSTYYLYLKANELKKYKIAFSTTDTYTIKYNNKDVTDGITLGKDVSRVLVAKFNKSSTKDVTLTVTKSAPEVEEGYGEKNPLMLEYGENGIITGAASPYEEFQFSYENGVSSTGYVAFTASHKGTYSFSFTYETTSSYYIPTSSKLYKVDKDGNKGSTISTSTSSNVSYNQLLLDANESLLLTFNLDTTSSLKKTAFSVATVSAVSGAAVENATPLNYSQSSINNTQIHYYKITGTGEKDLLIDSNDSIAFKLEQEDGTKTDLTINDRNEIEVTGELAYVIVTSTSSSYYNYTLTLLNKVTLDEEITYDSYSITNYYLYVNEADTEKTIYLTYSSSTYNTYISTLYYGIDVMISGLQSVSVTPYALSTLKFVIPSQSQLLIGYNSSYSETTLTFSETTPDYYVNFKSNSTYEGFSQRYNSSYFEFVSSYSSSYTSSEMSITVTKNCSMSFSYKSYNYNSNDGLVILVNGNQVLSRVGSSSSSYYNYSINDLVANDVVTFRYVKNSSTTSSTYYGAIRNITLS